jgi:acyl-CoA thioesterase I
MIAMSINLLRAMSRMAIGHARRLAVFALITAWSGTAVAARIACVGDSITFGWELSDRDHQSYPAVLQTLLGTQHSVKNFGTSGRTVLRKTNLPYWKDGNFRASGEFEPDVVVVMLGSNDAKPSYWPAHKAEFTADYTAMIEHYRALGALVYVATPPPVFRGGRFGITTAVVNGEIVPLVRQVAASAKAPLIDVFAALSGKDGCFPDTVHPNADGAKLIAQTVAAALQQGGFGGARGPTATGGAPAAKAAPR